MVVDLLFLKNDAGVGALSVCPAGTGSMSLLAGPQPDASFELVLSLQVRSEVLWAGCEVFAWVTEPNTAPILTVNGQRIELIDHVVNLDDWHGELGPFVVGLTR